MFPGCNDVETACSILKIGDHVSFDIVKKKYRELSMIYHPDKYDVNKGKNLQSEAMKCINKAHDYILDYLENKDKINRKCNLLLEKYSMKNYCGEWHYKTDFVRSIISSYEMRKRKKEYNINFKIIFEKYDQEYINICLPVLNFNMLEIMCNFFDICKDTYDKTSHKIDFRVKLDKLELEKVFHNIIFLYDMSFKEESKLKSYLFYITMIYL